MHLGGRKAIQHLSHARNQSTSVGENKISGTPKATLKKMPILRINQLHEIYLQCGLRNFLCGLPTFSSTRQNIGQLLLVFSSQGSCAEARCYRSLWHRQRQPVSQCSSEKERTSRNGLSWAKNVERNATWAVPCPLWTRQPIGGSHL